MKKFRILDPREYEKLKEFPPYSEGLALPAPDNSRVAVVEEGERIMGFWVACVCCHTEPIYIDPAMRDGGFTATGLLKTLVEELHDNGIHSVYVFSNKKVISSYLERLGFSKQLNTEVYFGEV